MIYIDASRYGNTEQRTGVERYSHELIDELVRTHAQEIVLIAPKKIDLPVSQITIPFPRLWTHVRLSWEALMNKTIDNLFVPSHVLPLISPKKSVITIHDVAFCRFPESYGFWSRLYLKWSTQFAVSHATTLIVPSQATQEDLIAFFKAAPEKIRVIPHGHTPQKKGIDPAASERLLKQHSLNRKKYFFTIGRIETKKNLLVLIEVFKRFVADHQDYKLVLAGKDGVGHEAIHAAAKAAPNIIFLDYVEERTKSALFAAAAAFVFPSLYEGFGFPLLEAMEYGLPIIASDIPSSREAAEGAAVFFVPTDADALEKQLKKIITESEDHDFHLHPTPQKQKGILQRYSWQRCAEETWKVLTND
ncbi:glycosyltransferase family 4 protein [Candidatus Peregrinibacteria bacterium]|nr:glycosyltransferase family 4 protein [Candidatus Peregrinibacteria bacterium]